MKGERNMKPRIFTLVLSATVFSVALFGQFRPDSTRLAAVKELNNRFNNSFAVHWNEQSGTADIITLSKPISFGESPIASATSFLQEFKPVLRKRDSDDELAVDRSVEKRGIHYVRFKQYYKGLPVRGGEYVVTVLSGAKVQLALGGFYSGIQINVAPQLTVQQALSFALKSPPFNAILKDSLKSYKLLVYPKDGMYFLAWEIHPAKVEGSGEWVYIVNSSDGTILTRFDQVINEIQYSPSLQKSNQTSTHEQSNGTLLPTNFVPQPKANVYLHHPGIDESYSLINPINANSSGYIQGTYVDVLNDATSRAYDAENFDFTYEPSNTHFDEGNLFYHIDRFRRSYWNVLDDEFNPFTQITAHAHWSNSTQAAYNPTDHHLRFGDGGGNSGYNSFAKEDKVIMHEYTHAVTDFISDLAPGYSESGAIHEGNSDYFASTFTDRTLIGEYAVAGISCFQRNISSPRISNYTQYSNSNYYICGGIDYGLYEPHFGSELWSRCLWDVRGHASIGASVADWIIYKSLEAIPTTSSFLQYRQAIISADVTWYGGTHVTKIAHIFYARGIGTDSVGVSISGPGELIWKQNGTWTATGSGGNSSYTYEWRYRDYPSGSWSGVVSTSNQYTRQMPNNSIQLQVKATSDGMDAYKTYTVLLGDGSVAFPSPVATISPPAQFEVFQNYPNPFNPETEIAFNLPEPSDVSIAISDLLGREVLRLTSAKFSPGYQAVTWQGTDATGNKVGSGIYFCRITAVGESGKRFTKVMKMALMK